jgi:hypothetical protein
MDQAVADGTNAWNAALDPNAIPLSKKLHYMLTQLMKGTPLDIPLNCGEGEGVEAWRRLINEYDPRAQGSQKTGQLMEILRQVQL